MSAARATLIAALAVLATLLVFPLGARGDAQAAVASGAAPSNLLAQIPAPASGAAQARGTYVGQAGRGGNTPYIGLVIQGRKVAIYVCDGKKLGDWFGGTVKRGRFTARSAKGTRLVGRLVGGRVKGTVRLRGKRALRFTARLPKGEKIGLFRRPPLKGHTSATVVLPTGVRGVGTTPSQVIGLKASKTDCTKNPSQNAVPGGCALSCEVIRAMILGIVTAIQLTNKGSQVQNIYIEEHTSWSLQADFNRCPEA